MMASSAGRLAQSQSARQSTAAAAPTSHQEIQPAGFYSTAQNGSYLGPGQSAVASQANGTGKPPLPPRPPVPLRSESELSDISEVDEGSDFLLGQQGDSDDSSESVGRKRQRMPSQLGSRKRLNTPEDTEMRRKLRGNTPQEDLSHRPSTERASGSERAEEEEEEEEEDDPLAVPERAVSHEAETAQKAALRTSWELVAILDFLSIFQPYLKLDHLQFSADELCSALVLNNGTSGLLPELHIGLMKGISSRSNLHSGNWPSSLAEKLRIYWRTGGLAGSPPFTSQRRREAATYATLPLENRVVALRILCELRLDREDLHNVVEHALHPPRKTKAERKAAQLARKAGKVPPVEPVLPTMAQMRREPDAKDSSGLLYWYLDYHTTTGTRLYREMPDGLLKAKGKKEQSEPQWELIASTPEELTDLGEKLRRSKKKPDQILANMILDDFVPELLERREADFRKQRAAAKIQSQLNNILKDEEGGYGGRSRRARKTVNYSFDAYDATIRAALRGTGRQDELDARTTRSQAFTDPRMTAEEEAQIGLRRGRSAHAAEEGLELPQTRRGKPGSTDPSCEPTPTATAEPTPEPSMAGPQDLLAEPDAEPAGIPARRADGGLESPSRTEHVQQATSEADLQPSAVGISDDESAEVEISDLGSQDGLYEDDSLCAGVEEISSVSEPRGEASPVFEDDSADEDWR